MSSDPASAKSTPTKKKPGRKKKVKTPEKSDIPAAGNGTEETSEGAAVATQQSSVQLETQQEQPTKKPKKGGLWALPIVPKPPQKPPPHSAERRKSPVPPSVGAKSKGDVDLCDVWRQGRYSIEIIKPHLF